MSPEWVIAAATVGTFVVIAGSAMAAIRQLRHMRASNQIAGINHAHEVIESPAFAEMIRFIRAELPERLQQTDVRCALLRPSWFHDLPEEYRKLASVANFFETLGLLVKNEIIDRRVFCEIWSAVVAEVWQGFGPLVTQRRIIIAQPILWENFEYLAVLSEDWLRRYPNGGYPRGMRRSSFAVWPETTDASLRAAIIDELPLQRK
ncbi:MAG: DUF4760 domain-containing protein [Candidatus Eremiobacteraeota bacterium]|nr:DUF4760 domain-containing protein [Candidatus Eremiobacteraeota bacterium]